jgi:uncharacterized membrane protein YdjX (TVP38/TMEM64 family)
MRARKILSLLAFPCLFLSLLVVAFVLRDQLLVLFSSPQMLREWIRGTGVVAPLVFVAVQAFQVVVFFIPGEIPQVAGGYLFVLGVLFVNALFKPENVERTRRIANSPKAKVSFFLFFLIPGIPKDILCYVAGLSIMKFHVFLLFSTLGRIPGIIGSALMGDAAADRRWILAGTILFVAAALFVLGFLFRERIQRVLERLARRRSGRRGTGKT